MKTFALLFNVPKDLDVNMLIHDIQKKNKEILISTIQQDLNDANRLVQIICPLHQQCTFIESTINVHTDFINLGISDMEGISMQEMVKILYFTARGSSSEINFSKNEKIIVSKPLAYYDSFLPKYLFCRISRFHIINLHKFNKYYYEDGGYVIMEDGQIIHVTDSYKDNFLRIIGKIS